MYSIQSRIIKMSGRDVGAGGPFKPAFGLSGAVLQQEKVFPRLVRAFVPSSRTQSPPALHNPLRSGENCSIPSLPDVHTILPLPAFTPASQKRARWGPRIAMDVSKLLNELPVITNVEIVVPFCQKCSASPINRRDTPCFSDFSAAASEIGRA